MAEDPEPNSAINGQDNPPNQAPAKKLWNTPSRRHPGGRPTKYRRKYCDLLLNFFDSVPNEKGKIIKSGKNWRVEEDKLLPKPLPNLEQFAWQLGINVSTIGEWCNEHPEFSLAIARAKQKQKEILVQGGLAGAYESRFAQFVAINFTDMRQKIEIDGGFTVGPGMTDEKVREIAQEAARASLRGVVDVPKIPAKTEKG